MTLTGFSKCRLTFVPSVPSTAPTVPVAPTNVILSATAYTPPTPSVDTVVGTLSAMDANAADTFTYSVVGGQSAALFSIVGNQLVLRNAGQRGIGLQVNVRVTDSAGLTFSRLFVVDEGA